MREAPIGNTSGGAASLARQGDDADPAADAGGGTAERAVHDHFLKLMLFQPSGIAEPARRKAPPGQPVRDFTGLRQGSLKWDAGYHLPDATMGTRVRVDSPAIEVMTDFRRFRVVTVGRYAPLAEANETMIGHGVRALLVVDDDRVLGLITARDVLGEKPLQLTHQRGIRHDEISVKDVMTPADRLEVIEMAEVLYARVGDVLETLKRAGRQHGLVVDESPTGRQMIRGVLSVTQIARQLGIAPSTPDIGRTFAEIEAAIGF